MGGGGGDTMEKRERRAEKSIECSTKDGHIKTIHSANLTRFYIKSKTMMIYRITCRIMFIFSRFCAKLVFHPFSANLYTTHKGLGEICCSIF